MARRGSDHLRGLAEPLPTDDEIVIARALSLATGASVVGHPHHLIANRCEDLKEMRHDVTILPEYGIAPDGTAFDVLRIAMHR